MSEQPVQFTQADAESLSVKLREFSLTLSAPERACLAALLYQVTDEDGADVQGFQYYNNAYNNAFNWNQLFNPSYVIPGGGGNLRW